MSICIPVYKEIEFVDRAIRSCQSQTFDDYEIVITDDTPDDSMLRAVSKAAENDNRIKYFRNLGHHGAAGNSNYAVEKSTGEWIKLLYQDDEFSGVNSLETFVRESSNSDVIFSACYNNGTITQT